MLKVLTLNIWHDAGPWPERLSAIRAGIDLLKPDLIGLQEVLCLSDLRQHEEIAHELGYEAVFGKASTTRGDGQFGNALLSKFKVEAWETVALPTEPGDETRAVLCANLASPTGPLNVYCTHLSYKIDQGAIRTEQIRALQTRVGADERAIVMGDFNAAPETPEIQLLAGWTDCHRTAGAGPGYTFTQQNPFAKKWEEPNRRIDYIFLPHSSSGAVKTCRVVLNEPHQGVYPTDHFGVYAEIEL